MKSFKIWATIECYDEISGEGFDIDLPELLAEFEELEQARSFIEELMDTPLIIHSNGDSRTDETINLRKK